MAYVIPAYWSLAPLRGHSSEPFLRGPSNLAASNACIWGGLAGHLWPQGTLAPASFPLNPPAFFLIVLPWPEGLSFLTSLEEGVVIEAQPVSLAGLLELIREEDLWACG